MKALKDLTKDELISILTNNFDGEVDQFEESAICVTCCGGNEEYRVAKYFYICDSCQQDLKETEEEYGF
jgi:hypothetical protein